MRLLADENIPLPLVVALRDDGHDVLFVTETMRTASDIAVLHHAIVEQRILVTFDSDFGRMIFAEGHPSPPGVIFIRKPPPSLGETIARVRAVTGRSRLSIDGYFVSIDRTARFHPLPNQEDDDG